MFIYLNKISKDTETNILMYKERQEYRQTPMFSSCINTQQPFVLQKSHTRVHCLFPS